MPRPGRRGPRSAQMCCDRTVLPGLPAPAPHRWHRRGAGRRPEPLPPAPGREPYPRRRRISAPGAAGPAPLPGSLPTPSPVPSLRAVIFSSLPQARPAPGPFRAGIVRPGAARAHTPGWAPGAGWGWAAAVPPQASQRPQGLRGLCPAAGPGWDTAAARSGCAGQARWHPARQARRAPAGGYGPDSPASAAAPADQRYGRHGNGSGRSRPASSN